MFGMGMTEILVILVVAVIFLGPDKLPEAASKISKGIRDIRKQTRELQQTIENDTDIGGAIRELKSALRGDEIRRVLNEPVLPSKPPPPPDAAVAAGLAAVPPAAEPVATEPAPAAATPPPLPSVRLPPTAGETSPDAEPDDPAALAKLIRPATGTAKRGDHG